MLVVVVAVMALVAASGYGFAWSTAKARDLAVSDMELQATRAAESISSGIAIARQTVEAVAAQPSLDVMFATPSLAKGCTLTAEGIAAFPNVRLDIVRADGLVVCSSAAEGPDADSRPHAGSEWLEDALSAGTSTVRWDATDAATGTRAVVVAAPVATAEAPGGAVVGFLHIEPVGAALASQIAGLSEESFTLVEQDGGTVVSASEVSASSSGVELRRPFTDRPDSGEWIGVDGSRRQFASAQVDGGPWRIFAGVPSSVVFAEARGAFVRELAVGVVALVLLVVAAWILNRRVAGPLRKVTEAVVKASREPTRERVHEAGTAELITLAREFNAMLDVRLGYEAQLAHQATHDPLTGLPNITLLRDRLQRALDEQRGNGTVAVLAIGLNRFKILNDSLGHDGADRVLVELSERLSAAVSPGDTLGRFSGDEFIVLCENVVDVDDAARRAEVVQGCLKRPFHGTHSDIVMSASIGVAMAKGAASTAGQLLREADSAMYQAKRGGHQYLVFDQALQTQATQHLKVEQALRKGLERHELLVHYQPLFDISSGRIVGAEALVRWQHPEWGLVPPLDFIPVAEQTGQITAIGNFVLTEACRQAAAWQAAGHRLRMSVNVAVDQLDHSDFPEVVFRALAESGLPSEGLCLEITESSLMRTTGRHSSDLARLRNLGVRLAIDDFGTGYSSLSYLHQLPVDQLKIDRSFISRLDHERDRHLVEAIIGMATALGLTVVAEGVESAGQLEALAELGCQFAQGYLFAPPQPPDGFTRLVQAQRAKSAAGAAC